MLNSDFHEAELKSLLSSLEQMNYGESVSKVSAVFDKIRSCQSYFPQREQHASFSWLLYYEAKWSFFVFLSCAERLENIVRGHIYSQKAIVQRDVTDAYRMLRGSRNLLFLSAYYHSKCPLSETRLIEANSLLEVALGKIEIEFVNDFPFDSDIHSLKPDTNLLDFVDLLKFLPDEARSRLRYSTKLNLEHLPVNKVASQTLFKGERGYYGFTVFDDSGQTDVALLANAPEVRSFQISDCQILDGRGAIMFPDSQLLDISLRTFPRYDFDLIANLVELKPFHRLAAGSNVLYETNSGAYRVSISRIDNNNAGSDKSLDLSGSVLFIDSIPTTYNHAHWLLDGLGRVVGLLNKLGKRSLAFFTRKLTDFQLESLNQLGIDTSRIRYVNPLQYFNYKNAVITLPLATSPSFGFDFIFTNPEQVRLTSEFIRDRSFQADSVPFNLVYIPRQVRRDLNSQEVASVLCDEYGASTLNCDSLSFEEERRIFASVDILVSSYGAAFANMIFMRPGSVVIALHHEHHLCTFYAHLANVLNIKYIAVCSPADSFIGRQDRTSGRLDFVVELDRLRLAMDYALTVNRL